MVLAATDLRHYRQIARASFRFGPPVTIVPADVERIHGKNERIGIEDYMRAIAFYEQLIGSAPPAGR